jgi:hypothetical protein
MSRSVFSSRPAMYACCPMKSVTSCIKEPVRRKDLKGIFAISQIYGTLHVIFSDGQDGFSNPGQYGRLDDVESVAGDLPSLTWQ